jgi:hypothetical protein
MLCDWLTDMHLVPAGATAALDRYVGYYRPYATSHADLDAEPALFEDEPALFEEVRDATRTLIEAVARYRAGERRAGALLSPSEVRSRAGRRSRSDRPTKGYWTSLA